MFKALSQLPRTVRFIGLISLANDSAPDIP